jgi:hypothetical protein
VYKRQVQGRPAAALPLIQRALTIYEPALGPGHPNTVICRDNLAAITRAAHPG